MSYSSLVYIMIALYILVLDRILCAPFFFYFISAPELNNLFIFSFTLVTICVQSAFVLTVYQFVRVSNIRAKHWHTMFFLAIVSNSFISFVLQVHRTSLVATFTLVVIAFFIIYEEANRGFGPVSTDVPLFG